MKTKVLNILVVLLLLTGCGKSQILTCTSTEESDGLQLREEVAITFSNKKASNVAMSVDMKAIDDDSKKMWSEIIDFYTKKFPISNEEGLVVKALDNKDSYHYTINMVIDLNKVSEDTLTKYELDDLLNDNDTINDIKLEAEQNGFTCNITEKSN